MKRAILSCHPPAHLVARRTTKLRLRQWFLFHVLVVMVLVIFRGQQAAARLEVHPVFWLTTCNVSSYCCSPAFLLRQRYEDVCLRRLWTIYNETPGILFKAKKIEDRVCGDRVSHAKGAIGSWWPFSRCRLILII